MDQGIRARVETDDDQEAIRVDSAGEVSAGGATFAFSIERPGSSGNNEAGRTAESESKANEPDERGADNGEANSDDPQYIAPLEVVPTDGTIRCEALGRRRPVEFILRQREGTVTAWRNSCPHEPDVRLDPGWGAMVRNDQIVCHEHGARFEGGDGLCTYGPCRGKVLDPIGVEVREGAVYLADKRFDGAQRL